MAASAAVATSAVATAAAAVMAQRAGSELVERVGRENGDRKSKLFQIYLLVDILP